MEYNIRAYVDELFRDVPDSQRAYEMKVELTQNLLDKYNDLLASGKSQEDAYNITIYGIGDITELLEQMRREEQGFHAEKSGATYYEAISYFRRRSAGLIAVGVMLYIFSVIPLVTLSILSNVYHNAALVGVGLAGLFLLVGIATGLMIWNDSTSPKKKDPPEIVMDMYSRRRTGRSPLIKAIGASYWLLVVSAYFLISFLTKRWDITWIMFIAAPALQGILRAVFSEK